MAPGEGPPAGPPADDEEEDEEEDDEEDEDEEELLPAAVATAGVRCICWWWRCSASSFCWISGDVWGFINA